MAFWNIAILCFRNYRIRIMVLDLGWFRVRGGILLSRVNVATFPSVHTWCLVTSSRVSGSRWSTPSFIFSVVIVDCHRGLDVSYITYWNKTHRQTLYILFYIKCIKSKIAEVLIQYIAIYCKQGDRFFSNLNFRKTVTPEQTKKKVINQSSHKLRWEVKKPLIVIH